MFGLGAITSRFTPETWWRVSGFFQLLNHPFFKSIQFLSLFFFRLDYLRLQMVRLLHYVPMVLQLQLAHCLALSCKNTLFFLKIFKIYKQTTYILIKAKYKKMIVEKSIFHIFHIFHTFSHLSHRCRRCNSFFKIKIEN
jgi:hypothetical protein